MNHAYRIVFNRALGLCQVVSERASAHGSYAAKATFLVPRPSLLASGCLLALGMTMVETASAQTMIENRVLEVDNPADLIGDVELGSNGELRGTGDITLANKLNIKATTTPTISAATGTTLTLTGGSTLETDAGISFGSAGHAGTVVMNSAAFIPSGTPTKALNINYGTLALGAGGRLAATSAVNLSGAGTAFDISAATANQTIGSLAGVAGSTVTLGARSLSIGGDNRSTQYAGAMTGTGSLTKTGSGTLTLTGSNSYDRTNVNGGTLAIQSGGTVSGTGAGIIDGAADTKVTVAGVGSLWTNNDHFMVGESGMGALTVEDGGMLSDTTGFIGNAAGSTGSATVTGMGTTWNNDQLQIGVLGTGALTVQHGGKVSVTNGSGLVDVAFRATSTGVVNIGGAVGETAVAAGTLEAGELRFGAGAGSLNFNHADTAYTFGTRITGAGAVNQVAGTTLLTGANTYDGGTVVSGGTLVISSDGNLGAATGSLTLDGGTLTSTAGVASARAVTVGAGGGTVGVTPGVALVLRGGISGYALTKTGGLVILTADNTYTDTTISGGTLQVGANTTTGSLGSGKVFNNAALVFYRTNALLVSNDISGAGQVSQVGGSDLVLTGTNTYAGTTTINNGTLQVGDGGTTGTLGSGKVVNNAALVFNRSDSLTVSNDISGTGTLLQAGSGTTTLTGAHAYTGGTRVSGGTLAINGSTTGNVQVNTAGTLAGSGRIGGNVNVDGTLSAGNSPGTLSIAGNLVLDGGSTSVFELGQADVAGGPANDLVEVGDDLTLGGTLQAQAASAGWYRLFNYDGTLSGTFDATWVSSSHAGFIVDHHEVDTASAHQVNLTVLAAGQNIQFWDGSHTTPSGVAGGAGGAGSWSSTGTTWTDDRATTNSSWGSSVAHFGGTAGTVSVVGMQRFDTLQFASDGYLVAGDSLALSPATGGSAMINTDAGVSATIASTLVNGDLANGLIKVGSGTLILSGANRYSGIGTQVLGGTLVVAHDSALGSHQVVVDDFAGNNATLHVSAGMILRNSVFIDNNGTLDNHGVIEQAGSGFGVQSMGGATINNTTHAAIRSDGYGVLLYDGGTVNNGVGATIHGSETAVYSHSAATLSNAGTLEGDVSLGDDINQVSLLTGSRIVGYLNIGNHAASILTLDGSGSQLYSAAVTGTTRFDGSLYKQGAGSWIIDSALAPGHTSIAAGILQIGNGGSSGAISGSVLNNGTLAFNRSDDTVFAGDINGSGALQQIGSGTTTLSGNNRYSGGTVITAGTLAGNAGNLGSGTIDIAAAATLAMQQNSDASFANLFTGSGRINKNSAGTLNLTGDSAAFTGTTHINAGTLAVNGALGGSLNVHGGATLKGTGSVGSTVVMAGGTIAPGNSIGRLNVTGDLTFAAGSSYQIEAVPDGSADHIHASGAIALQGGSAMVLAADGSWSPSTTYQVLSADAGISGAFDQVSANFAFVTPTLVNDGHMLSLTLARNQVMFPAVATTPNQIAASTAIENLGTGNGLYDMVVQLDEANAVSAFDQLSGEVHASVRANLIQDSRFVREAAIDRLRQSQGAEDAASDLSSHNNAWGRMYGSWGRHDGDGNAARGKRSTGGIVVGGDHPFGNWNVGLMAASSHSKLDIDTRRSHAKVDSYQLGLYAGTTLGDAATLRSGVLYGHHSIETDRTITFTGVDERNRADYHASSVQAFGELGWKLPTRTVELEPFANLAYVGLTSDSFREHAGISALSARKETSDTLFSTLGVRAGSTFSFGTLQANWRVMAGWRHAFNDVTGNARLAFANDGSSFVINGLPVADDALTIDAGAEFTLRANLTVGAAYSGQHGDGARDHGVKANLTWVF